MSPRKWVTLLIIVSTAFLISSILSALDASGKTTGIGTFTDTGQMLGSRTSQAVELADLDGSPGLDAFVANGSGGSANTVWLNNGGGVFTSNGQLLGSRDSEDLALGDVDGANGVDAVAANSDGLNRVWLNDGAGQFAAGQAFESGASQGVGMGDLDGDSDPDVFFANQITNTVWLNQSGTFTDTNQSLGTSNSFAVELGDLDGDGDLDAFVGNGGGSGQPDKVWINQGGAQAGTPGSFQDSGQSLGFSWTYDIDLGDLDGDGDLDAFIANWFPNANRVFINQGGDQGGTEGVFQDSGQSLGNSASLGVKLSDVDGDLDLDAFVTNNTPAGNKVWLNDGSGVFSDSMQSLGTDTTHYDADLDDLDGDGDPDAFVASFGANSVYRNGPSDLPTAAFAVDRTTNENGDEVYYQAEPGNAMLPMMLSSAYTGTLEVHARIETTSSTITETASYDPGEVLKFLNLVNSDPDPSEAVTLTLSVTLESVPPTAGDETDTLLFYFIDGEQGLEGCFLCYTEWLGQLVGIDPIFDDLFHMELSDQKESPLWPYYTALFSFYSPEMSGIMASNPALLWEGLETIDSWTPGIQALSDGTGSTETVTQQMVDDAESLFDGVQAEASEALAEAIQTEQDALDFPDLVGLNFDQFWQEVESRRPIEQLYITIVIR